MLWFNFILVLNFILHCFKLIIVHYHIQKQRKIKFKPRIKLNHTIIVTEQMLTSGQAAYIFLWESLGKLHIENPRHMIKIVSKNSEIGYLNSF